MDRLSERRRGGAYAALDLGTNNCRLLIAAPARDGFRVLDSFSRIVSLGEGVETTGTLSEPAMQRTLRALQACAARLGRRPVVALRAVATEACRRAANGRQFLARAEAETGIEFELISPREEAELAVESCMPLFHPGRRRALLFDIGGGSTELAWVRLGAPGIRPELIGCDSFPLGVVTLADRFGPAAFTQDGYQAMVDETSARLARFEAIHCIAHEARLGGVQTIGVSGTVTTLAGVALNLVRYQRPLIDGAALSAQAADAATQLLRSLGREGLRLHPCVGPERARFVLPGCAIFQAIRTVWPAADVTVADRGLREGMLIRLMRRRAPARAAVVRPARAPDAALSV